MDFTPLYILLGIVFLLLAYGIVTHKIDIRSLEDRLLAKLEAMHAAVDEAYHAMRKDRQESPPAEKKD